ncbi:hypothetical protein WR25_17965 [Diploscapter pachys]|uniref:C-type lectin domain-containing protein n=1 Tax=Diploscapter pachys TaxID=2018661 RepID=A0A2A2LMX4_9BILA|nr:hypothetical protein WR25_17965 [Diploscapter pachys]
MSSLYDGIHSFDDDDLHDTRLYFVNNYNDLIQSINVHIDTYNHVHVHIQFVDIHNDHIHYHNNNYYRSLFLNYFATPADWDTAQANCEGLCAPGICHLPRLYSVQQGLNLVNYEIGIGAVGMARADVANVKAWSRFSYGDRDESQTFACISTSHDPT